MARFDSRQVDSLAGLPAVGQFPQAIRTRYPAGATPSPMDEWLPSAPLVPGPDVAVAIDRGRALRQALDHKPPRPRRRMPAACAIAVVLLVLVLACYGLWQVVLDLIHHPIGTEQAGFVLLLLGIAVLFLRITRDR